MGYWLLKPQRGGAAFWRVFMSLINWEKFKEMKEVKVIRLRLHSRAYLYLVPEELIAYIPSWVNLSAAKVKEINLVKWDSEELTVKYRELNLGYYVVRYIEVCNEGCYKVFRTSSERKYAVSGTESDTALAKTDSETVVLRTTDSETINTVSETVKTDSETATARRTLKSLD